MPKISHKRIHIIRLLTLSFVVLLFSIFETYYSPIKKFVAWVPLKEKTYSSANEAYNYVLILTDGEDKTPEQIVKTANNFGLGLKITEINKANILVSPKYINEADPNFLSNKMYTYPLGRSGIQEEITYQIIDGTFPIKTFSKKGNVLYTSNIATIYTGQLSKEELKNKINSLFVDIKSKIKDKKKEELDEILLKEDLDKLDKLFELKDLSYRLGATSEIKIEIGEDNPDYISVATIKLSINNCKKSGTLVVQYDKKTKEYFIGNIYSALYNLCSKPLPGNSILTCSNCWLAPVSKNYSLKSTYVPYVVATGVNGGGYVTPDTKIALVKLINAAKNNGLTPRVSSSYRSYSIQNSLFNSYVNNEMKSGLTYSQAVIKANTYSAKPGQSEHQLGTTVDILNCGYPCSFYDSRNTPLFSFFLKNAYKYGFAISYPDGSQPYTGYVYEPWHLRYVGVDRATELYNNGYLSKKGYYLYNYLLENREW